MIFERIKAEGLAHNSYFVGSGGSAAVIDPRRDCEVYVDLARRHSLRIRYIFETHRNEDYIVGSLELENATGAEVYHGAGLDWKYGNTLKEGQEFTVGSLKLTSIPTPGHTDESTSYALADLSTGATIMVFTGDALFVGETGRTDLYGAGEVPRLASDLYDSIFGRILPLGGGVILCPAHGAGSVCGINIADRDESTLGIERTSNPALQVRSKDEFVSLKMAEKPERPYYFSQMEKYNLEGAPLLGGIGLPPPLSPAEFRVEMERGAVVVDTREPASFGGAHIRGSYSIWLGGLPVFPGWLLSYSQPVLLVLEDDSYLERAYRYLIRIGYDRVVGFLRGGIEAWYNAGLSIEKLALLSVHELKGSLERGGLTLLDVRDLNEWKSGHVAGAVHIFVGYLESRLAEIPRDEPVAVMCSVGNRASIGASVLRRAGFSKVYNVLGSMKAWLAAGYPVVS